MKKNLIYIVTLIAIAAICMQVSKKSRLDKHYLSCFKNVKERLMYGSEVDTKKELEDYEDQIALYMHLDGYNDVDILAMKVKAVTEVSKERKGR